MCVDAAPCEVQQAKLDRAPAGGVVRKLPHKRSPFEIACGSRSVFHRTRRGFALVCGERLVARNNSLSLHQQQPSASNRRSQPRCAKKPVGQESIALPSCIKGGTLLLFSIARKLRRSDL